MYIITKLDINKKTVDIIHVETGSDQESYLRAMDKMLTECDTIKEEEDSLYQILINDSYRIELYKHGILYGKSLIYVYELQEYSNSSIA